MINITLLFILLICVITDVKKRKIYNKVIYPGIIFAFLFHSIVSGWDGFFTSSLGFLTGLGLLFIPYALGGMGAGDVKLLALIGAFKGAEFVFYAFLYTALLGGVIALAIIVFRRKKRKPMSVMYPYGVAIAGGAVINLFHGGVQFM